MGYKMKNKGNFNFGNKGNFDWYKGEGSIGDPVNYNDPDVKKPSSLAGEDFILNGVPIIICLYLLSYHL